MCLNLETISSDIPAPSGVISDADELVNLEARGNVVVVVVFVFAVWRPASRPLDLLLNLGLDLEDFQDVPVDENK